MSDETKPVPVAAIYRWNDDGTCAVEPLYSNARGPMTCVGYQILDAESARVCRVHCPGCAEAASLREHLADLRNERDHWREESQAAIKVQGDLRTRLAAAESQALALTNGERADEWERKARNANDEWQSAMRLQGAALSRASRAEAERNELRGRLERASVEFKRIAELARVTGWSVMAAIASRAATRAAAVPEWTPTATEETRCEFRWPNHLQCVARVRGRFCAAHPAIPEGTPTATKSGDE